MSQPAEVAYPPAPQRLSQLLQGVPVHALQPTPGVDPLIHDVVFDSRMVTPGALFVALRGGYADGHAYLQQAFARGAVATLIEADAAHAAEPPPGCTHVLTTDTRAQLATIASQWFGHPSRLIDLVGVTGTDGKTSSSYLIARMLNDAGVLTGVIGTVDIRLADEIIASDTRQTTPESLDVQRHLALMVSRGAQVVVLETTSHALETHRVDGCAYDVAVVTNVTHEHLDFHGTVENYRRAKGGLLRRTAAHARHGGRGIVVLNGDDPGSVAIEADAGDCQRLHYSMQPITSVAADIRALDIVSTPEGSTCRLVTPAGEARLRINLPGRFNVANALAAVGAGTALGLPLDAIVRGIASLTHVPGRMQRVDAGQPFAVIVDYAHTPVSIEAILREARRLTTGRVLIVSGSAGERDIEKRGLQGAVCVTHADYAVFTSEDPRFEDPDAIVEAIAQGAEQAGGRRGVNFACIEDRTAALLHVFTRAAPGDVVILAGKGHERSIIYGDQKRPWDEGQVANDLLHTMQFDQSAATATSRKVGDQS